HPPGRLLRWVNPLELFGGGGRAEKEGPRRPAVPRGDPVHRGGGGRSPAVEVARLEETAWHFLAELHAGRTIQAAINSCPDLEAAATLAQHLALGWFVAFKLATWQTPPPKQDFAA